MGLNPNCDGAHCYKEDGEVRKLPLGGGSNLILCENCFDYEINWRREENYECRNVNNPPKFPNLPAWQDLGLYKGESK